MNPSNSVVRLARTLVLCVLASLLLVSSGVSAQQGNDSITPASTLAPLGSGFTYQGELQDANGLVTATCDFQFRLLDSATNGNQIGTTQTITNVSVADGRFSVVLNGSSEFGEDSFMGEARWLEIGVRCPAGSGDFTVLTPRQELTATPYAIYASKSASVAWDGVMEVPADIADGDDDTLSQLTCADGEVAVWNGTIWECNVPPAGPQGTQEETGEADEDGLHCWDLNGNGTGDLPGEDANGDEVVDVLDCTGPQGETGATGPQGPKGDTGATGP